MAKDGTHISKTERTVDGTASKSYEQDILNGANLAIDLSGEWDAANSIEIINDNTTATEDLTVKFDATTEDAHTIQAGERFQWDDYPFVKCWIYNASGATISVRVRIQGFPIGQFSH